MKFKLIITVIFLLLTISSFAQIVKEKIGISIVLVNGKMVLDSSITYKSSYDNMGRQLNEWKVTRCYDCVKTDTFYTQFDTLGQRYFTYTTQFSSMRNYIYVYFNKLGLDTLTRIISGKDTSEIYSIKPIYINNILLSDSQIFKYQGIIHHKQIRFHKTNSRKNIQKLFFIKGEITIRKTKFNKNHKIILYKDIKRILYKEDVNVIIYKYKYDQSGNLKIFKNIENGILQIKSFHYTKNRVEDFSNATYYAPPTAPINVKNYEVITQYKYIYWSK